MDPMVTKKRKIENGHYIGHGFIISDDDVNAIPSKPQTNGNGKRQIFDSRKHCGHYPLLLCDRLKKVKPCKETSPGSNKIKKLTSNDTKPTGKRVSCPRSLLSSGVSTTIRVRKINPNSHQVAVRSEERSKHCQSYNGLKSSESELGVHESFEFEKESKVDHLSRRVVFYESNSSVSDLSLTPKKVARISMLKSRFEDTIWRAQKKLSESSSRKNGVAHRPEGIQRTEKPRSLSTVDAPPSKSEIQMKREAARAVLDSMKRTVDFDDSMVALREIQVLCGYPEQSLVRTQCQDEIYCQR